VLELIRELEEAEELEEWVDELEGEA